MSRQPSVPTLCEEEKTDHRWARGHTISEGVGYGRRNPTLETPLTRSETSLSQMAETQGAMEESIVGARSVREELSNEEAEGSRTVGVVGEESVGEAAEGSRTVGVGVAGEKSASEEAEGARTVGVGVAGEEPLSGDSAGTNVGVAGAGFEGDVVLSRERSVSDEVRKSPGFQFLTREDLYKLARVSSGTAPYVQPF